MWSQVGGLPVPAQIKLLPVPAQIKLLAADRVSGSDTIPTRSEARHHQA